MTMRDASDSAVPDDLPGVPSLPSREAKDFLAPLEDAAEDAVKDAAPAPPSRQETGDEGEALAAKLLHDGMGHEILSQHTPDADPHGVDIESLTPEGGIMATEVKATTADAYRPPHTTENVHDHQMDPEWTARELREGGQTTLAEPADIGDGPGRIRRQLVQVDFPSRTASVWDIADNGHVAGGSPREIWNLADFDDED